MTKLSPGLAATNPHLLNDALRSLRDALGAYIGSTPVAASFVAGNDWGNFTYTPPPYVMDLDTYLAVLKLKMLEHPDVNQDIELLVSEHMPKVHAYTQEHQTFNNHQSDYNKVRQKLRRIQVLSLTLLSSLVIRKCSICWQARALSRNYPPQPSWLKSSNNFTPPEV